MADVPLISVVVVTYNSRRDISACLDALQAVGWPRLETIVVDNASADGTAGEVERAYPDVRLVRSATNLGFGGGNNLGFVQSHGDLLLVLNPDVRLQPGALAAFADAFAADPRLGVAGAKLLFPDGRTIQHAGAVIDAPLATAHHRGYGELDAGQYDQPLDMPFVTGAALALRRAVLAGTGGFDAAFYPVYYEDADLCYRARAAGWRVQYLPQAVGLHRSSASLDPSSEDYFTYYHANRVRFVLKHYSTEQIVKGFLPAEAQRLRHEMPAADRRATRAAYGADKEQKMRDSDERPDKSGELERLVSDLEGRWLVKERPFVSSMPMLGSLVVRIRSAWNNVATRWYVQPMLQQQVEFNAAVLRAVSALARRLDAEETIADASQAVLGQRLLGVEERLAALEQSKPAP